MDHRAARDGVDLVTWERPPGRRRWETRRRALGGSRRDQERTNRPYSGRDSTTTAQTVIGHLPLVGPPEWLEQPKVAAPRPAHKARFPRPRPEHPFGCQGENARERAWSCGTGGPDARLVVPLCGEMSVASGPRGPARAAARRGHAPSPILWVLRWEPARARSSVGERLLHTQEVGGSKPPAPTTS